MSEMVERVARAIHERVTLGGTTWEDFIPTARAAIEAMREPTDKMLFYGDTPIYQHDEFETAQECAAKTWRAMIDAALTPAHAD